MRLPRAPSLILPQTEPRHGGNLPEIIQRVAEPRNHRYPFLSSGSLYISSSYSRTGPLWSDSLRKEAKSLNAGHFLISPESRKIGHRFGGAGQGQDDRQGWRLEPPDWWRNGRVPRTRRFQRGKKHSVLLKVFVARRREAGLNDQSRRWGAPPSYPTHVQVPAGPSLLEAAQAHENPLNPKCNQLASRFFYGCYLASQLQGSLFCGAAASCPTLGHGAASAGIFVAWLMYPCDVRRRGHFCNPVPIFARGVWSHPTFYSIQEEHRVSQPTTFLTSVCVCEWGGAGRRGEERGTF